MTTAASVAETWLVTTLKNDPQIAALVGTRVYTEVAPQGAAFPYIVVQQQAADDRLGVGVARIWSDLTYVAKAVDQTQSSGGALGTLAARIDALLHGASGPAAGGRVVGCVRVRPFKLAETQAGVSYRHLGGVYDLYVQET